MASRVIRGMTKDRSVRFLAADTTELVEKARLIHGTLPTSTAAFGRTLTGASLLGKLLKNDDEKVTLQIKGDNLIKSIMCVSNNTGSVKGYILGERVDLAPTSSGKLDVGGAIGNGELIVIKDYGMKEQFLGRVDLVNGEIAEDLATYFMNSEQQPSIVALGVFVNEDGSVRHAGGIIIQPMPDAGDEVIDKLEKAVEVMEPVTKMMEDGLSLEEMIQKALSEFVTETLDENGIDFKCDCSRDRIASALISIGREDLRKIIDEDGHAEVKCHFCNTKYTYEREELESLLEQM